MYLLFSRLVLTLKPEKCHFDGEKCLEILGIVFYTRAAQFLLSPNKMAKIEKSARHPLNYASSHRRFLKPKDIQRFADLAKASAQA